MGFIVIASQKALKIKLEGKINPSIILIKNGLGYRSFRHSKCWQDQTEVKHAFLEEALVNLDPSDLVTKVS